MSTPDESIPQEPPIVPEETAAQDAAAAAAAADAAQMDAIRELAAEIAKQAVLDFDPATIRKGVITAIADTSAPPTISVQISGDTTTTIDGIRYIDSYAPVVGDTALIIKQGTDLVALGRIAAAFSATAWTTVTLGAGWTHGGNGNGNVRYRKVWDNGSPKMQWRGAATRSSGTAAVSTPLATGYRPLSRVSVLAARSAVGGANDVKLDFDTDGTVNMVGGTTAPTGGTTGNTTPGDSTHSHGQHEHIISESTHSHGSHEHVIPGSTAGVNSHSHSGTVPNVDHQHPTHSHSGTTNVTTPNDSTHSHSGTTNMTTPNDSTHNHGSHNHSVNSTVDDPPWVSFQGIEYFLD
jgi:hypothetical protein